MNKIQRIKLTDYSISPADPKVPGFVTAEYSFS